jgi:molecular chaperone DnaJ
MRGSGFGFGGGFSGFGFGGNARRYSSQVIMPEPLQIHLRVTVSEIYSGATKHVKYKYMGECSECNGTGHLEGGKIETCPHCHGSGIIMQRRETAFGYAAQSVTCPYCSGTGQTATNPCGKCHGTGLEVKYDEIDIDIPAGVCDGAYMQINGKGNCAKYHTEIRGLLIVIFDVQQDSKFQIVNQYDLQTQIEVPILDCITGCEQTIDTVDGKKYKFKLEPGAETGKVVSLRGMGMKKQDGSRGNMMIRIKQRFPKSISKSEMKKIEELKKSFK